MLVAEASHRANIEKQRKQNKDGKIQNLNCLSQNLLCPKHNTPVPTIILNNQHLL